jgi:solute carrier family 25 carnitine/acylcarnitine transporter 20/29
MNHIPSFSFTISHHTFPPPSIQFVLVSARQSLTLTGLQTQPTPAIYSGPLDCVRKLYANGGLAQVFRAQVPCMIRDGVGMGCYFLTYEALVQRHLRVNGGERGDISPLWAVGFGAAAGYGLWFS